jgi:sirohydrochlorin ferrochelatase
MQALIVVAHGSRRAASNQEVFNLIDILLIKTARYVKIVAAFLELVPPTISESLDECVASGATEVIVLPYFLSAGRHVSEDIELAIASKREEYPQLIITIKPHIGTADGMVDILLHLAQKG